MLDKYFTDCLYFTANRLTRVITRMAEEEFARTGLSPAYAFLLMAVQERNGLTQKELGEVLHLTPSTVTRFVEKLERKLLVTTRQDGRMSRVYLTDKGRAMQEQIEECWSSLHERYAKVLGREEGDRLTRRLYEVSVELEQA
ncbi:Transcriptional regulator, MarR family protein [Thermobacillus xylanilyticus]|jgi:DNA-binding MarR family transcriptional regulator|uniref:Transcriptional regulator, MarR family protein n=1 Tax=Thermobacillus xylanilyticus TaxID=76633 RepID=A0ABN7RN11_THEXY|nr:MarR family transcriptional regulator [Thermobacillus xylanilyticus]CAG5081492.1 Transcriptional regulator, MarR family protein [Thermobacillus xylanilyticus]